MRLPVILLVFSFWVYNTNAQQPGYSTRFAATAPADAAEPLAYQLTGRCKNEKEKVLAIIDWITSNIAYQVRPWANRSARLKNAKYLVEDPSDTATFLKPLNERIADLVIRRGEAYCDGYARLFTTLCDFSGIQSAIITGYSRTNMDRSNKFRSNHTWNAVRIDSVWHLLDVTWASGFITYSGNEFIRRYDDQYIFTPPSQFIRDHYPEDLQWTLLPAAPGMREFASSPFKQQGFIKTRIASYTPEKGILNAAIGDTLRFELETGYHLGEKNIADTLTNPSSLFMPLAGSQVVNWQNIAPVATMHDRISYEFIVRSSAINYINLVLNDHIIMRYNLKVEEPSSIAALP